ncbi:hypothetical protein FJY94_02965 [Candidatus Kaiserbacteria bacterium]|nr:hypothetical protein [Candidatus Kaiserbacteria bacterium]
MDNNPNTLEAIYRLTKENNEMLHSMRRAAFLSGIFKFLVFLAVVIAPVWFYMTYLDDTVRSLIKTMSDLQGTNSAVSAQSATFMEQLRQLQSLVPAALEQIQQGTTTAQ